MSGLSASGGVYNAAVGQESSRSDGTIEAYVGAPPLQDGYHYSAYAMGRITYPPEAILPPSTSQYSPVQPILHQGLSFATVDVPFPTGQFPATMAPSVLTIPPMQIAPDRSNPLVYLDPRSQMTSTSAPTIIVGDWVSQGAPSGGAGTRKPKGMAKKPRQQFSACTACRIRRVKCDLKDLRVEWEKQHAQNVPTSPPQDLTDRAAAVVTERGKRRGNARGKPNLAAISRKEDIRCTNCHNRDFKCIDEFAHRKRLRSSARDISPSKRQEGDHSNSPTKPYPTHPYGQMTDQDQSFSMEEDEKDESLSHSKVAEKYLLPPESSGLWRTPSNLEDFYSPLEEKSAINFGEISCTEGSQFGSRDAREATEYEELSAANELGPTHRDPVQEPQMESSLSVEQAEPGKHTVSKQGGNKDASLYIDERARLTSPDPIPNSSATSRPVRQPSRHAPRGHRNLQSDFSIPDLDITFFESDFYRRFHTQRPIIDPIDFKQRYISASPPCAGNMGKAGAILCHLLYAWACSYGINEFGELDVMPVGWHASVTSDPAQQAQVQHEREVARRRQLERTNLAVREILREIDHAGIYRNVTWDGVRCLLLVLPLTEYTSTSAERSIVYDCALGQVFQLCSASALGYDGLPHKIDPASELIRRRLYWYAFVHEGITTGLKGGRMVLDEDDFDSIEDILPAGAKMAPDSSETYTAVEKFAIAPIRLSMACRLIHKALTGAKARRSENVDRHLLHAAWDILEESWSEFDTMKAYSPGPFARHEDIVRFADGWKIFMFEAHNVVRESLEHRMQILLANRKDPREPDLETSNRPLDTQMQIILEVQSLRDIARAKCEHLVREITAIVKRHLYSSFFEWDASLVRDGIYYIAMLLVESDGVESDTACYAQALTEMRWAFSRSHERTEQLSKLCARPTRSSRRLDKEDSNEVPQQAFRTSSLNEPRYLNSLDLSVPAVSSLNLSDHDLLASVLGQESRVEASVQRWQRIPEPAPLGPRSAVGSAMRRAKTDVPLHFHDEQMVRRPTEEPVNESVLRGSEFQVVALADQPVRYMDPNEHIWHFQGRPHATGGNTWPHRYP